MRSRALLLAASLVVSTSATTGCTARAAGPAVAVGTIVTALGIGMLVSIDDPEYEPDPTGATVPIQIVDHGATAVAKGVSIATIVLGVALVAGGMVGIASSDTPSSDAPTPEGVAMSDPDLDRLTLRAMAAARAGDCAQVKALAGQVNHADPTYFRTTFVSQPTLASCLR